jgi:protein-tyrosine sulfotransferase
VANSISVRARRLYADLITGRTRVRMAQPVTQRSTQPAFLVGPYRSGTTVLRLVLDSHSQLACPPETTFMAHLSRMLGDPAAGFDHLGFDRQHTTAKLAELADYFYASYAASAGKPRWIDKSPEYVWHLDWMNELFPDARFVFLVRNGLDQADSHLRSGHEIGSRLAPFHAAEGEADQSAAVRYWLAATEEQLAFHADHRDNSTFVSYEDFCADPAREASRLFSFLGLPWEEGALRFHEHRHDFGPSDTRARVSTSIERGPSRVDSWDPRVRRECSAAIAPTHGSLVDRLAEVGALHRAFSKTLES